MASSSLSAKDMFSLGFSAVALMLTLLSTYFNPFWQVQDVQVRVAEFTVENRLQDNDRVVTHLAFVNRGNQPTLITGVQSEIGPDPDPPGPGGGFGAPTDSPRGTFPFVLDKGQLKLVEIHTPVKFIEGNADKGKTRLYYQLRFASINSRGQEQGAKLGVGEIFLDNQRVVSFNGHHAAASLSGKELVAFRVPEASPNTPPSKKRGDP